MKISILTVFEQLYVPFVQTSLVRRAIENQYTSIDVISYFSLVAAKDRIDAPIFGHGAGMLIKPEVVQKGIEHQEAKHGKAFKIFFSPQGKKLDQPLLEQLAATIKKDDHLMLLPARYEGMDTRVENHYADLTISVGDFVLMGGDIPAMMLIEGLLRCIPGVIGKEESVHEESFSGPFVDYPTFAPPVIWKGYEVPEVVRSGNHAALHAWRQQQAACKTVRHHFEWLRSYFQLTQEQKTLAEQYIPPHYVVLMHSDVYIGPQSQLGTTSVTTMDIHDIARSCSTYGIKKFFIVTPLIDQQKVVKRLVEFWLSEEGIKYNQSRHNALQIVHLLGSLDEVIEYIKAEHAQNPVMITTSAKSLASEKMITYSDQEKVWQLKNPLLLVFGTGRGLAQHVMDRSDFILLPVHGFSAFNHLSVRSAVAVILDRWLGINEKRAQLKG